MNVLPRWWHSRKGMIAVIVLGGYVLGVLLGKELPSGYAELARIVVVALFLTANGENGGHFREEAKKGAQRIVEACKEHTREAHE